MSRKHGPSSHQEQSRDNSGFTALHNGNLYDLDEDNSGERIDFLTGNKYDNSTQKAEELGLNIIYGPTSGEVDPPEVLDFIDEWLAKEEKLVAHAAKSALNKQRRSR